MKPLIMNNATIRKKIANVIDTIGSIITPQQIPVAPLIVVATQLNDRDEIDT